MAKFLHESAVLKPRDPSLDLNTDEWPEFDLSNVSVHLPDDSSMASLLLATEHYPLTVRGQLLLSDEHTDLLLQPTIRKRVNVEITDVKTFSYGQYTNGTVALWAAGKSGWYSINPGRIYKQTFHEMTDAVNIFYFIVDAYRDARKRGKGKNAVTLPPYSAQEVFQKYAAEVMEEPSEHADAAERFYRHRDFLLSGMVAGKEGMIWSHNPFLLHLSRRFPTDYANVKRRVKGPRTRLADRRSNRESAETASCAGSLKRKRSRVIVGASKFPDVIDLESTPETDVGMSVVGVEREGDQKESQTSRHRLTRSNKGRRTRQNDDSEMQAEAGAMAVEGDDSDDEASVQPSAHRKRKSLLRLKPSKASKSVTRGGKAPVVEEPPDDNDPATISPDTSVTELQTRPQCPSKRRNSDTHEDEDEGIDMADSHSGEDPMASPTASDLVIQQEFEALPLRTLDHQPDPVQEDTWVCALDGCAHKVYTASALESQKLIREHYALHAYDDDERVQMVKRLQAPSLPVRHLMERVRQQARVEGFPGSRVAGTRYPETLPTLAIAQKY